MIRYRNSRNTHYRNGRKKTDAGLLREATSPAGTESQIKAAEYLDLNHARQKAYRLLALRPHSAKEMEKKLRDKGFPAAVVKEALEKLHELKYLDDVSFASQWARHLAVNKLWGNKKIFAGLQAKGLSANLINEAIDAARSEMPEEEAVTLLIRKKTAGEKSGLPDIKEKKRIFQSLLGRGFPAGLILNKLGKIPEEDIHGEDGQ